MTDKQTEVEVSEYTKRVLTKLNRALIQVDKACNNVEWLRNEANRLRTLDTTDEEKAIFLILEPQDDTWRHERIVKKLNSLKDVRFALRDRISQITGVY